MQIKTKTTHIDSSSSLFKPDEEISLVVLWTGTIGALTVKEAKNATPLSS